MTRYKGILIVLNLAILLTFFNFSVVKKETIMKEGQLILLELAPVDPRSLMQGDYMTLNYSISNISDMEQVPKRGYYVLKPRTNGLADRVRIQESKSPLHDGEVLVKYTKADWNIHIGAESFFFQEGHADWYENAKFGGLRVDKEGNSVLIGLYDANLKQISCAPVKSTNEIL